MANITVDSMSYGDKFVFTVPYGVCSTAAATAAKVVTVDNFGDELVAGAKVTVKFTYENDASDPTLNVNGTGAKPIYRYGTTAAGDSGTSGWAAGSVITFTYDGAGWVREYWINTTYYTTAVQCTTAAATAAKTGTCSYYNLNSNRYFVLMMAYANTAKSALTLNIKGNGAKPIYINGTASSDSNYTLPAGMYVVYYNGTNYYLRTDGYLPGIIDNAYKLQTARTIDGVSFNGTANITHYGTCSTAAATAAKTVACTSFTLATGAIIRVKFTVTNTADNPTLNVNSTGAKSIFYRGAAITAGYLAAGRVYTFVYDGTNYELVGDINTDTNTKNTTGTTNLAATKLFLAGAKTQAANPQTYSNVNCYIGTDDCLYSGGTKVSVNGHEHSAADITSDTLAIARIPTITAAKGGSGKTTLQASANAYINALSTGTSTPVDDDYMITQAVGGGTSNTTYYRRKMSSIWNYIRNKANAAVYKATITSSGTWSGTGPYTQTITVSGILSTDTPVVDIDFSVSPASTYSNLEAVTEAFSNIYRIATADDSITVYAKAKPSINVPIVLRVG